MRILIIGNLGYIGPIVAKHFKANHPGFFLAGYDIGYFIQNNTFNGIAGDTVFNIQYYGDVRNFPQDILKDFDAVIYLAAISNDPMGNVYEKPTLDINYHAAISIAARLIFVFPFFYCQSFCHPHTMHSDTTHLPACLRQHLQRLCPKMKW